MPRVSIGMPVHDAGALLPRALDSLLAQTYRDFELIISDNASSDDTPAICRDYARRDPRIRYIRQAENIGPIANFNYVFGISTGEYFKWAAHDDIHGPRFVEMGVRALDADRSAILFSPGTILMNADETPFAAGAGEGILVDVRGHAWHWPAKRDPGLASDDPAERFAAVLLSINLCFEIFGLMRSATLRRTGLLGSFWGSDKVLLAELSLLGRYSTDETPLFFWRHHPSQSMSQSYRNKQRWISVGARRALLPRCRLLLAYLYVIRGKGLTPRQRMRCLAGILRRLAKKGRLGQLADEVLVRSPA
jgi:glycosyltransferase involved in cell wall biosynthesis